MKHEGLDTTRAEWQDAWERAQQRADDLLVENHHLRDGIERLAEFADDEWVRQTARILLWVPAGEITQHQQHMADKAWCACGHGPEAHRTVEGNCPDA